MQSQRGKTKGIPKMPLKLKKAQKKNKNGLANQSRSAALSSDPDVMAYELALLDPFNVKAEGARVPDLYSTPTATYHLRGIMPINSTSVGSCAFALLPSPLVSSYDTSAASGASACIGSISNGQSPFTSNPNVYYSTTPTELQGVYSVQRVVAAGWKIRVVVPPFSRAGKIIIAPIPMADEMPGWNTLSLSTGTANNVAAALLGAKNVSTIASSGILALPGAKEYSLEELAQNDVILRDRPTGARYYDFHNTNTSAAWLSGTNNYVEAGVFTAGNNNIADRLDPTRVVGHTGFIVVGIGLSPSLPTLDVEYVYHLEGLPALTTSSLVPIASGASKKVTDPNTLDKVLMKVSNFPFVDVVQAGLDTFMPAAGAAFRTVRYL